MQSEMLAFPPAPPLSYTKMCGAHLVMLGKEANEHRAVFIIYLLKSSLNFQKLLNYLSCQFLLYP